MARTDVVVFQLVSMGSRVSEADRRAVREEFADRDYLELDCLLVQLTEDSPEYGHARIRG